MNDRLETIFQLQKKFESYLDKNRYPDSKNKMLSAVCTAIIHEAVELQRLTNWKWWKKESELNIKDAKEELIDIWHFVVQTSLLLGLTPDDILYEYKRKHEINMKRQDDGY